MRLLDRSVLCAAFALFALSFPSNIFAQGGQQPAASAPTSSIAVDGRTNQSSASAAVEETASSELPDSPSAVLAQQQQEQQQTQNLPVQGAQEPTAPSIQEEPAPGGHAPAPQVQQGKPQRPVGTAAAESPMVSGVTAAQPAGVAIAPAKQRRVRTLVIKIGAIAGAGVALGTVMALTMGTPSKPPGAH